MRGVFDVASNDDDDGEEQSGDKGERLCWYKMSRSMTKRALIDCVCTCLPSQAGPISSYTSSVDELHVQSNGCIESGGYRLHVRYIMEQRKREQR